jgi:hypothetical protein
VVVERSVYFCEHLHRLFLFAPYIHLFLILPIVTLFPFFSPFISPFLFFFTWYIFPLPHSSSFAPFLSVLTMSASDSKGPSVDGAALLDRHALMHFDKVKALIKGRKVAVFLDCMYTHHCVCVCVCVCVK